MLPKIEGHEFWDLRAHWEPRKVDESTFPWGKSLWNCTTLGTKTSSSLQWEWEPGKTCGMGKSLHCSTAALETGRQRSNAFQILKELLQHRTLLRGWDKDTVRYSRLSPLPCTLSEKVTGGCLSSKQGRNQEKGKDVKLEIGDLVEERGAGWGQEGSSVPGTEDSLELGKVKRYKRESATCSQPRVARGMQGAISHLSKSLQWSFASSLATVFQGKPMPIWPHSLGLSPLSSPLLLLCLSLSSRILGPWESTCYTFDWDSPSLTSFPVVTHLFPREGLEVASWTPSQAWAAYWKLRCCNWGLALTYLSAKEQPIYLTAFGSSTLPPSGLFSADKSSQPLLFTV